MIADRWDKSNCQHQTDDSRIAIPGWAISNSQAEAETAKTAEAETTVNEL